MAQDPNENSQLRQTLQTLAHKNLHCTKITPKKSLIDYFRCRDENNKKCSKSTQANLEAAIFDSDLTNDVPSEKYWEILAEKRRLALEETLKENECLHSIHTMLKAENLKYKTMLEEANSFITVFKEVIDSADDTGIDLGDVSECQD